MQVKINKRKIATSIEYFWYHGMLKDWTLRWDAPLCLSTNSTLVLYETRDTYRILLETVERAQLVNKEILQL